MAATLATHATLDFLNVNRARSVARIGQMNWELLSSGVLPFGSNWKPPSLYAEREYEPALALQRQRFRAVVEVEREILALQVLHVLQSYSANGFSATV